MRVFCHVNDTKHRRQCVRFSKQIRCALGKYVHIKNVCEFRFSINDGPDFSLTLTVPPGHRVVIHN